MPNIDKVIDGLKHCLGQSLESCNSCPYHRRPNDTETYNCQTMHREAMKILIDMKRIHNHMTTYITK